MNLQYNVVIYGGLCRCSIFAHGIKKAEKMVKHLKAGGSTPQIVMTQKGDR